MLKRIIPVLLLSTLLLLVGCTTQSTRLAIGDFERASAHKQQAFDNAVRVAEEQLYLSLAQYLAGNHSDSQKVAAVEAAWRARDAIYTAREQYLYGVAYEQLTVGQYLYDQQGWFSVLIGDVGADMNLQGNAIDAANKKTGVQNIWDLIPDELKTRAGGTGTDSGPPVIDERPESPSFQETFERLKGILDSE